MGSVLPEKGNGFNMRRLFITGDKHGVFSSIEQFCQSNATTKEDAIIILGDAGVNYWGGSRDKRLKRKLEKLPITFLFVRGNHESRPSKKSYKLHTIASPLYSGTFLVEDEFPSLLFMVDGEEYYLGEGWLPSLVLGGAYSVDKYYRLEQQFLGHSGYRWFYDEQLSEKERADIDRSLASMYPPKCILSHTCPIAYTPREKFIPLVDQSSVDHTMEKWLQEVKDRFPDAIWYCGHWHTDKWDGNVRFMYEDIIEFQRKEISYE